MTETPDIEGAVTEVAKDLGLNVGPKDDRWDPIENPRSLDEFEVARLEYLAALLLYNDRQQEYALG